MAEGVSRRHFFMGTLLAGAVPAGGFGSVPSLKALGCKPFNEKLNIAGIGVGGRGADDLNGCSSENIVALCDVDSRQAAPTFKRYEKATRYTDFRKLLDKERGENGYGLGFSTTRRSAGASAPAAAITGLPSRYTATSGPFQLTA